MGVSGIVYRMFQGVVIWCFKSCTCCLNICYKSLHLLYTSFNVDYAMVESCCKVFNVVRKCVFNVCKMFYNVYMLLVSILRVSCFNEMLKMC